MLDAAVRAAGIGGLLDAVLSADAVRQYKTHPSVYEYALRQLGLRAEQVSFQSSNAWDAQTASAFGMRVVWCNRYGQRRERLPGQPDRGIRTLAELPALLAPRFAPRRPGCIPPAHRDGRVTSRSANASGPDQAPPLILGVVHPEGLS